MNTSTIKDPTAEATRRQTFAIFTMSKRDVRPLNLNRQQASNVIDELKQGNVPALIKDLPVKGASPKPNGFDPAAVHREALEAANKALRESDKAPNPHNVISGGKVIDTIPDLCGFAWVNFKMKAGNARKMGQWLIKQDIGRNDSYYGGCTVWAHTPGQGVTEKENWARAYAEVLRKYDIPANMMSRLD